MIRSLLGCQAIGLGFHASEPFWILGGFSLVLALFGGFACLAPLLANFSPLLHPPVLIPWVRLASVPILYPVALEGAVTGVPAGKGVIAGIRS